MYRDQGAMIIHSPVDTDGAWNSEIVDELKPGSKDIVLSKRSDLSAFSGTNLETRLKEYDIERLIVAGFSTNSSILETIKDISSHGLSGVKAKVLMDGCASESTQTHFATINDELPAISEVLTTEEATEMLESNPCSKLVFKPLEPAPKKTKPRRRYTMFHQVKKLRIAMCDKWIAGDRFVRFLDRDADGQVDYDEFYDFLHQFGIAQETRLNVREVFDVLDANGQGSIPIDVLLEALRVQDDDFDDQGEEPQAGQLAPFPSPFLVGLVAHNNMKPSMMKFVKDHLSFFSRVKLVTTGSTGRALSSLGLDVEHLVSSGPLGGDQEIGGLISEGKVCAVFFFTDPLSAHPHSPDIAALNRICCVHDCMFANNPSSAELLVFSLEHSAFGYSRLTGLNPTIGEETDVVGKYKEGQAKVIQAVSAPAIKKTDTLSTSYRKSVLRAPRAGKTEAEAQDRASSIKATRKSVMFAR